MSTSSCHTFNDILYEQNGDINTYSTTTDTIRICTGYKLDGKIIENPPIGAEGFENVEPIFEDLPGWKSSTFGISKYSELPEAARRYLKRMEEVTEVEIAIISTGPDRVETIVLRHPFDA